MYGIHILSCYFLVQARSSFLKTISFIYIFSRPSVFTGGLFRSVNQLSFLK